MQYAQTYRAERRNPAPPPAAHVRAPHAARPEVAEIERLLDQLGETGQMPEGLMEKLAEIDDPDLMERLVEKVKAMGGEEVGSGPLLNIKDDDGRLPEAEAGLNRLINTLSQAAAGQERRELCDCLTARATVLRYANRWRDALADLDLAAALGATLTPLGRRAILTGVYSIRAKLLAREGTGVQNLDQARDDLAQWRALGGDGWMFDEVECELARHANDWRRVAELSARVSARLGRDGWPVGESFARLRTANALLELGDIDRAEAEVQAAYEFFSRLGPPDRLAAAELVLARILAARGQFDRAWPHAEKALDLGEKLIRHFRSLADQRRFAADKLEAYGHAFDIALATGGEPGVWRAWSVAERAKSFCLCQLVANSDVNLFEGLAGEIELDTVSADDLKSALAAIGAKQGK